MQLQRRFLRNKNHPSAQRANSPGKETTITFHATTWSTQYKEANFTHDQLFLLKSSNSRQMILLVQ
jgi:hypothetical protein